VQDPLFDKKGVRVRNQASPLTGNCPVFGAPVFVLGLLLLAGVGLDAVAAKDGPARELASYTLSLENRKAEQRIPTGLNAPGNVKFVEINITEVMNPERIPVSFDLEFGPADGERVFLGTFSLFPPNNPGTFIVAAQGNLENTGSLILTLRPVQQVKPGDTLRIRVEPFAFRR